MDKLRKFLILVFFGLSICSSFTNCTKYGRAPESHPLYDDGGEKEKKNDEEGRRNDTNGNGNMMVQDVATSWPVIIGIKENKDDEIGHVNVL